MALKYNEMRSPSDIEYNLDPTRDRLLVPSKLSEERAKYSEAKGFENNIVNEKIKNLYQPL